MLTRRYLIALSLVLACHSLAIAQQTKGPPTDAQRTEASGHFRRAVELFQEDAFRASLVEFQRAYDIAPDYRLLYNIGQAKLRLQDYLGSVQSYEAYLVFGGTSILPERRTQVEEALASLRQRVGRIGVTSNRAGAEVFIDDLKAGTIPLPVTVAVNVGRHRVLVRAADGVSDTKLVDVAGGDVTEVSFELAAAAVAAGPLDTAAAPEPWSLKKKAAVGTWAGGGLLLGAAVVTAVLAGQAQSDLDARLKIEGVSAKSVSKDRDSLKTLALTTDLLIGAGAAAVVVGTVLWFVDRGIGKKDETKSALSSGPVQLDVGLASLRLRGQF